MEWMKQEERGLEPQRTCDRYHYALTLYASGDGEEKGSIQKLKNHLKACPVCEEKLRLYQEDRCQLSQVAFPPVGPQEWKSMQHRVLTAVLSGEGEKQLDRQDIPDLSFASFQANSALSRFGIAELAKGMAVFLMGLLAGSLVYHAVKKPSLPGVKTASSPLEQAFSRSAANNERMNSWEESQGGKDQKNYFLSNGLQLETIDNQEKERWNIPGGLIVRTIDPNLLRKWVSQDPSYRGLRRLQPGAILLELNNRELKTSQDFIQEMRRLQMEKGKVATLKILRNGTVQKIIIQK